MGGNSKLQASFMASWLLAGAAHAADWTSDIRGDVAVEARGFWEPSAFKGQSNADGSLLFRPELHLENETSDEKLVVGTFLRVDSSDRERTHFDLREFAWSKSWADYELTLGVQRVFWGAAESNHVVDVINQTDQIENPDGEDKLGQPMATLALIRPWGTVEMMVMPWFRERTFPGRAGRLRSPVPIAVEEALYESSWKENHVDVAIRYNTTRDSLDLGLYQFHGTSREPTLLAARNLQGGLSLRPYYPQIDQTGLELAYTLGGWLFKYEGIYRTGQGGAFTSMVGGFEYTFSGLAGTGMDLGVLLELNFDSRGEGATTPFNRDVFIGFRLAPNDVDSSQLLAGMVLDVCDDEHLLNVELQRRIGERWRVTAELRAFQSDLRRSVLNWLDRDDYLGVEVSRFF